MSKDVGDRGPVIYLPGQFITDLYPEVAEAFIIFHGRDGDTTYRLLEWSLETGIFTAATAEGEAMLRKRGIAALRDALIDAGERLGE